jgi:hypothetical protein
MRVTLNLPDELLHAANERARETRRTLAELIADCLRVEVRRPGGGTALKVVPLPTFSGNGLQPGITLQHGSALEDL